MLNIFTSEQTAQEKGFIVEKDIDTMFSLRSENIRDQYLDAVSEEILHRIEGMTERKGDRINGKFGDVSLFDISTGGKGCLLAINYKDFIIDASQLGENCLKLLIDLAENREINIVYLEPLYIFDEKTVSIDGDILSGYEASKAMEDVYYAEVEYNDEFV